MTDRPNVFMYLESEETVDCGWNRGKKITLWIRCHENSTALILNTDCHMTSSEYTDYGEVIVRLDDTKATTLSMDSSTNNRSLGLWTGAKSIGPIKKMFGRKRMVVRATPYGENPFTATFQIAGTEEAIKPLRAACDW